MIDVIEYDDFHQIPEEYKYKKEVFFNIKGKYYFFDIRSQMFIQILKENESFIKKEKNNERVSNMIKYETCDYNFKIPLDKEEDIIYNIKGKGYYFYRADTKEIILLPVDEENHNAVVEDLLLKIIDVYQYVLKDIYTEYNLDIIENLQVDKDDIFEKIHFASLDAGKINMFVLSIIDNIFKKMLLNEKIDTSTYIILKKNKFFGKNNIRGLESDDNKRVKDYSELPEKYEENCTYTLVNARLKLCEMFKWIPINQFAEYLPYRVDKEAGYKLIKVDILK